jgi:hypothetical protein
VPQQFLPRVDFGARLQQLRGNHDLPFVGQHAHKTLDFQIAPYLPDTANSGISQTCATNAHRLIWCAGYSVFVTNLLTGSRSRLARNTGEATGFMAEFHALFYTNCRYQKQAKSHFIFYFSQFNIQ